MSPYSSTTRHVPKANKIEDRKHALTALWHNNIGDLIDLILRNIYTIGGTKNYHKYAKKYVKGISDKKDGKSSNLKNGKLEI